MPFATSLLEQGTVVGPSEGADKDARERARVDFGKKKGVVNMVGKTQIEPATAEGQRERAAAEACAIRARRWAACTVVCCLEGRAALRLLWTSTPRAIFWRSVRALLP